MNPKLLITRLEDQREYSDSNYIFYYISIKDRRKYNFLMNGFLLDWFYPKNVQESIFDKIVLSLFDNGKISKYSYIILKKKG